MCRTDRLNRTMKCVLRSGWQPRNVCERAAAILLLLLTSSGVASADLPTPSPKPSLKSDSPHTRPARTGEPIYASRSVGNAPAKRKTKAEMQAYRRRLERDWDNEVARREKGDEKITAEQIYLWRRMDRPWGAPFRNFIEDRARYGDPSLGR